MLENQPSLVHARFHNASVHGVLIRALPARLSTWRVVELAEKKTADCSRRELAIGGAFCDCRSNFDSVFGFKVQIFAKSASVQLNIPAPSWGGGQILPNCRIFPIAQKGIRYLHETFSTSSALIWRLHQKFRKNSPIFLEVAF